MGLKRLLVGAATAAWAILVVGGVVSVYTGRAEPYLSPSDVPVGSQAAFVGMLVLVAAGLIVGSIVQKRLKSGEWQDAGRRAGFRPGGGSLPDLTGTVDGRPVRARLVEHTVSQSGEGAGSTTVVYTYVETELSGPADDGVIVGGDWGEIDAERGSIDFEAMAEDVGAEEDLVAVTAGDLYAVGTSEAATRAVAAGRVQEAVRSLGGLNLVYVGDASRVVASYAEAQNEELEGSIMEFPVDTLVEAVPGDAATVTIGTKAWIRDGDELRRQAEAAVAIADASEEAAT